MNLSRHTSSVVVLLAACLFLLMASESAAAEQPPSMAFLLSDDQAWTERKMVFGSMHSTQNIRIGNPDETLRYLWGIEGDWKLLVRHHGKDFTGFGTHHRRGTDPAHPGHRMVLNGMKRIYPRNPTQRQRSKEKRNLRNKI